MRATWGPRGSFVAVVLATILRFLPSYADIGIFGGLGETVFPIGSEDVRMVSERVMIRVGPPGKGGGFDDLALVEVKAEFAFENESDKGVNVRMGFPDQQGRAPGEQQPRALMEKLTVHSDGLPVKCQSRKGVAAEDPSLPQYDQVFVWNSSFAPGEKKKVELSYVIRMSGLSEFDVADTDEEYELSRKERARILRFYREVSPFIDPRMRKMWQEYNELLSGEAELWMVQSGFLWSTAYRLQTGGLWKGNIGQAYIELDFSRFLRSVEPLRVPVERSDVPEGYAVALIRPEGFQWKGAKLIWEMRDFEPTEDIQVGFLTVFYIPRDAATLRRWLASKDGKRISKSTLTMLKACLLALHGRTSRDPLLKTFLENSMPYAQGKRYASKTLPRTAREIMAEIDRALASR